VLLLLLGHLKIIVKRVPKVRRMSASTFLSERARQALGLSPASLSYSLTKGLEGARLEEVCLQRCVVGYSYFLV